ncbi:MAG TPA: NUDIX domain-containing protein [Solirubrobacteraceae bacterium]|nr:NUDIX domain-containing protein [Solirubrobacteraceae bacterium]
MSESRGSARRTPHDAAARRRRGRAVEERSAGGVVVKGDQVLVVVPTRRAADGSRVLALPKGHLDGNETDEQAAAREVREEGGVEAELVGPLGEVRYHYRRDGRLISKGVRFFLFEFSAGSPEDHDHEIEDAHWLSMAEAIKQLTYPGERAMVQNALSKSSADR